MKGFANAYKWLESFKKEFFKFYLRLYQIYWNKTIIEKKCGNIYKVKENPISKTLNLEIIKTIYNLILKKINVGNKLGI